MKLTIVASALCFGSALHFLKEGQMIAREGWNGKGMFVYLVPAASYSAQTGAAKAFFGEDATVPYRAYLALKTADDDVATWAPSCSDVLAEDWLVIAEEAQNEEAPQGASQLSNAQAGYDPHWQEVNARMECLRTAASVIATGNTPENDTVKLAKRFYDFVNSK